MTVEAGLRLVAGLVILASVLAGMLIDPRLLWITLFVGANLLQSAFTNWCPMMTVLRWLHFRDCAPLPLHRV